MHMFNLLITFICALVTGPMVLVPIVALATPQEEDSIREEDRLGARSDPYSRVFDRAISALVKGDAATFRSLLSSSTVLAETRGPGAIDAIIQNAFIPFFSDFAELTESISTAPTYNSRGNTGIGIARSFKTKSGTVKPFVIYLINETQEGKQVVVVGNLLINNTGQVLQRARPTGDTATPAVVEPNR
ncbi:MAG: hypothetical protein ACK5GN_00335 [Pseudomonadota bacterium]